MGRPGRLVPKVAKGRIAEQKYVKRIREILLRQKKRTKTKSRKPWKQFFDEGIGATLLTEIPKASIHSIVYTYGKNVGKKFVCSCTETEDGILVRIEDIKRR